MVPLIGAKRVGDIDVADVERMIQDIATGKTARDEKVAPRRRVIVRGGTGAARKVASDLSAMFSFAERRGLVSGNAVKLAHKPSEGRREDYLTLDEVARLGTALAKVEQEGASTIATNMIRLLILTGCRRNEVAALRWSEVDLDRACLHLRNTKTGRSVRPLGTAAIELLRNVPRLQTSEFVFPATFGRSHFQGLKRVWARVRAEAGLGPNVVLHTLRHTVGSAAVSSGETMAMTGTILGHVNHRSTAIYAHIQSDPAKKAIDRVMAPIAAALKG